MLAHELPLFLLSSHFANNFLDLYMHVRASERWAYTMNMRILYAINCTKHRIWHLEMEMEQQAEWERSVCRIFRIKTLIGHGHVHSKMVTAHSHIEWNFQYNLENYLIECSESLSAPDRLGTPSHT